MVEKCVKKDIKNFQNETILILLIYFYKLFCDIF